MSEITCSRCGSQAPALERAPLPGEVGELLLARTCSNCWGEWAKMQVMLMNERRLSPADPAHYAMIVDEMKIFLGLRDE